MDQHDKNNGQQVYRHSRKISNKGKSPMDWMGEDFCQTNVQACREIKGNITSPRAHTLHAVEDKHKYKRRTIEWDMEMTWEQMQRVVECTRKCQSITLLYLANTREVGSQSRDSEGVVWWWGKRVLFWGSYQDFFWEKCLTRMAFFPKEVSGVLLQTTKNKTYAPKNTCSGVSKDRSHREYLA